MGALQQHCIFNPQRHVPNIQYVLAIIDHLLPWMDVSPPLQTCSMFTTNSPSSIIPTSNGWSVSFIASNKPARAGTSALSTLTHMSERREVGRKSPRNSVERKRKHGGTSVLNEHNCPAAWAYKWFSFPQQMRPDTLFASTALLLQRERGT